MNALWIKKDQLKTEYNTKFDEIIQNKYKMRFYILIQTIKGWFK
tara:strand:+ start:2233 stop:2364 length:132 start_codon:yes stop_codon:yes gene_type:complete